MGAGEWRCPVASAKYVFVMLSSVIDLQFRWTYFRFGKDIYDFTIERECTFSEPFIMELSEFWIGRRSDMD
jgi:hypothetical protein